MRPGLLDPGIRGVEPHLLFFSDTSILNLRPILSLSDVLQVLTLPGPFRKFVCFSREGRLRLSSYTWRNM